MKYILGYLSTHPKYLNNHTNPPPTTPLFFHERGHREYDIVLRSFRYKPIFYSSNLVFPLNTFTGFDSDDWPHVFSWYLVWVV